MTDSTVTIISEVRNLCAIPFRPKEDQLSTGKLWEDRIESVKRGFRFFRVANSLELIIYSRSEVAQLEESLPDPEDPSKELDVYPK